MRRGGRKEAESDDDAMLLVALRVIGLMMEKVKWNRWMRNQTTVSVVH